VTKSYETENVLEEIKMDTIENRLAQYKQKYLNLVSMMEDIIYPKQLLDSPPILRRIRIKIRRSERPLKRLLEG
jgi:hypothetical protein